MPTLDSAASLPFVVPLLDFLPLPYSFVKPLLDFITSLPSVKSFLATMSSPAATTKPSVVAAAPKDATSGLTLVASITFKFILSILEDLLLDQPFVVVIT